MSRSKLIQSFIYAFSGIGYAFRSQFNMRIHVAVTCLVIASAVFFHIDRSEWCIILLCIGSVISAELINTSIEINVDLTSPGFNEKAGLSKDVAAAAVLVVSIVSALIGLIIFVPKVIHYLN